MQQLRRVVDLALVQLAVLVAPRHAHALRGADAQLAGRPDREDAAVLDDRHAVGELLGLVEVVRRQHDGLAEVAQRADRAPRRAARRRVEAGRRLVEEDQLGVADERQREVQPALLAARQRRARCRPACPRARRARSPRRGRAGAGTASPSARPSRAASGGGRSRSSAGRCRAARAARARAAAGSKPSTDDVAARRARGSPRGSRPSSSCRRRWARAARTPRRGRPRSRCRAPPRARRRPCAVRAPRSPGWYSLGPIMPSCDWPMRCACIDIGSNTTRLLVAESRDGRLQEVLATARVHAAGRRRSGGADPRREGRRGRRAGRLAGADGARMRRRGDPHRRHRGDPPGRQPRGVLRGGRGGRRPARGRAVAATTRRGWRSRARRARCSTRRSGEIGVVDVGGGSSELVVGTMAEGVSWSASFRVGSAFLADGYLRSDPPSVDELDRVRAHVAGRVRGPRGAAARTSPTPSAAARRRCAGVVGAELNRTTLGARAARPAARRRPRRSPAATSCTPSASASCPPGCCCSTRPRGCSAARCASPRAACARESSSKNSPPWDPERMAKARTGRARRRDDVRAGGVRDGRDAQPRAVRLRRPACSTPRTSSASTTCASRAAGCAPRSRSSRRASTRASTRTCCARSSGWPTRWASAATPTSRSRALEELRGELPAERPPGLDLLHRARSRRQADGQQRAARGARGAR